MNISHVKKRLEKELKTFYRLIQTKSEQFEWQESKGEEYTEFGLKLFLIELEGYQSNGKYILIEAKSGVMASEGKTKKEVFDKFKSNTEEMGVDKLNQEIQKFIDKHGISPLYKKGGITE